MPAGQTTTRFAFVSVSAAGGDPTFGNFLDAVSFGTAPCLVVDKSVQNLSHRTPAEPGDTLLYSVTVSNHGGIDAQSSIATDALPADLTYTPGSLVITTGTGAGALTDAIGDDAGEYDPTTRRVTVRLGTGADALVGGSIAAGASVTFQFDATPTTSTTTAQTIENTASTSYVDPITGSALDSTSQTTVTSVGGELAATGVIRSSLPMPIALLMVLIGATLVVVNSKVTPARKR